MTGTAVLASTEGSRFTGERKRDLLRVGLLGAALLVGLLPIYRFIGSMIAFHEFLGDYQVFWGIGSAPLSSVYGQHGFPYPVTALLLVRPFGVLSFWPSFVAWGLCGAIAIGAASRRMIGGRALALGFCTSAMVNVLASGQTSLFVGALIIAGLSARSSLMQGLFLAAAAVIKPQSVLAAPAAMLAGRRWSAIGWAITGAIFLTLLSVAVFGVDAWIRWATNLNRFPTYLSTRGIDLQDVGTYGIVRGAGLPGWTFVFGIPLGVATGCLAFREQTSLVDRYAAFVCSTVLMCPYTMSYDLAGLSLACTAMLLDRDRSPLVWVAAALIVSSIFANLGIVMMATVLSLEGFGRLRNRGAGQYGLSSSDTSSAAFGPRSAIL